MRILVVEDEPVSLHNARKAIENIFGHTPEVVVARSVAELLNLDLGPLEQNTKYFDLILTDMNIPVGNGQWDVCKNSETAVPVGLLVLMKYSITPHLTEDDCKPYAEDGLRARTEPVPCLMVTDANGHRDALGLVFEKPEFWYSLYYGDPLARNPFEIETRPERIHGGKDWERYLKSFLDRKNILAEFRIDL